MFVPMYNNNSKPDRYNTWEKHLQFEAKKKNNVVKNKCFYLNRKFCFSVIFIYVII